MQPRPTSLGETLTVIDLGADVAYSEGLERQMALAEARRREDSAPDVLLLLEHAPVFTLGCNADRANVLWSPPELAARGIGVAETSRGGDVTYHGPGQLVGYPILRIGREPRQVVPYVDALEETLRVAVSELGVQAGRDSRNRGLWVGNAKLAAIGVRVSGGVTQHGFALNVAPDLAAYAGIVPCGLRDAGVTSLAALLPEAPPMSRVKEVVVRAFALVFGFRTCRHAAAGTEGEGHA